MPEAFGQKIRHALDLPLHKKSFFFWFIFPIISIISLIIHFYSLKRRQKSYVKINSINEFNNFKLENIKIICVGNILIGGTGKSPVVHKIALSFLKEGYLVAIASRGIGKNIQPLYVCNKDANNNFEHLSDENREHFEILSKFSNKDNIFYILQNKSRILSLQFILNEIHKKNNYGNLKIAFILDDGIQHFACPRDINICLWSPKLLLNSPNYSMPIGPYREGFGNQSFHNLLNNFDFRFWSRTKENNIQEYKNEVKLALEKYNLTENEKDIFIIYKNIYYNLIFNNNNVRIGETINKLELDNFINSQTQITIITGIANPKNFMLDLKLILNNKKLNTIFLNDHSQINQKALDLVENSSTIILTLKDVFRWCQNPVFFNLIKEKNIIACSVDVCFMNTNNEMINIINCLTTLKKADF